MDPRVFLRVEGLTALAIALGGYLALDGPIWLLLALALAPDLSMFGYLAGPRLGSWCYNVVHAYTVPVALGALGVLADAQLALLVSLVWAGHTGADRLFGYGLKLESGFTETHLSAQPAPVATLTESDR